MSIPRPVPIVSTEPWKLADLIPHPLYLESTKIVAREEKQKYFAIFSGNAIIEILVGKLQTSRVFS